MQLSNGVCRGYVSKQVKDIISTFFSDADWRVKLHMQWPSIVGELSDKVSIEKIEGDTLVLSVIDSCWLQELYFLSSLLRSTINKSLDQPRIKQIRFKKATVVTKKEGRFKEGMTCPIKRIRLSHAEQYALDQLADKELQKVLERFCIRCHRERT